MAAPEAASSRGMKNQVRIRGPKPDVSFPCKSLDELESLLQGHIEHCYEGRLVPETVYAQFIFDSNVALQIKDLSDGMRDHFPHLAQHQSEDEPGLLTVPEAVAPHGDAKAKLKRQRAVGRIILKSIQNVDGFKYFEKEAWDTKHSDGYRFKYLCRDSFQNKDRAANKNRSSNASTFVPQNGADASGEQSPGKEASRLATYDCKGSIFVKFSSSQQIIDVVYQHLPIHRDRDSNVPPSAPVSRPSDGAIPSAANGAVHEDSGEPMETTETVHYETPNSLPPPFRAADGGGGKGKKRKRAAKPAREAMIEAESSEQDADDDWDMDNQAPPPPLVSPSWEPDPGDADFYRPSVVTRVPGLKAQMKQAVRQSYRAASADSSSSGSAYEGKKQKRKPGPKSKGKAAAAAAAAAATSGADSDRPTRKRTKTGCWTCRSRKLKCDENRPQCSQCARSRPPRECSFPDEADSTPAGAYS